MKVSVIFLLCMISFGIADQTDFLFQEGVKAYQNQDYDKAVEHFQGALQLGHESAALYFNLGNSYYKTDDIARAIANYERAKRMDANDEDIAFNLQIAQLRVVDKIPTPEMDYFFKIWQGFKNSLGLNFLTIIMLSVYVLLIGLVIIRLLVKKSTIQNSLHYIITPTIIIFVITSFLFGLQVREDLTTQYGVILSQKVAVTSSPSVDATEVFALHEGVKVRIIAESGDFSRIRLSDGKDGWVLTSALEVI